MPQIQNLIKIAKVSFNNNNSFSIKHLCLEIISILLIKTWSPALGNTLARFRSILAVVLTIYLYIGHFTASAFTKCDTEMEMFSQSQSRALVTLANFYVASEGHNFGI